MDLFLELEVNLEAEIRQNNITAALRTIQEMETEKFSIASKNQRKEAERKIGMARKKIVEMGGRANSQSTQSSSSLYNGGAGAMSHQDIELMNANRQLGGVVKQGRDAEDVAIATKINMAGQTEHMARINQQQLEMRNKDIAESKRIVDEIEYTRRKNIGILCAMISLILLAFIYIIYSNLDKKF